MTQTDIEKKLEELLLEEYSKITLLFRGVLNAIVAGSDFDVDSSFFALDKSGELVNNALLSSKIATDELSE